MTITEKCLSCDDQHSAVPSCVRGLSTLLTRARLAVGKLIDEQPLPRTAKSDGAFLDTQLFFQSLVEAVGTRFVAADSSGAHGVDVVR